jgi:3-dehydroquinate dehydratase
MQPEEKLLDAFGVLADLQSRSFEKAHQTVETLGAVKRDIQEIRIDILQIRTALQQLHTDLVRVAYLLSETAQTNSQSEKTQ